MNKSIPQRIRDRKADQNKVTLRDAGLIDERGVITMDGRYVLRALLLEKYEAELVKLAEEHLREKQADVAV